MLQDMRALGLDFLITQIASNENIEDSEAWYRDIHERHPERLTPFLVESSDGMDKVFVVGLSTEESGQLILESRELTEENKAHCPFVAQTGNVPQLGPLFKPNKGQTKTSPTKSIITRTIGVIQEQATQTQQPWSEYFASICKILEYPSLRYNGVVHVRGEDESLIELAIRLMDDDAKAGVFLAILDEEGRLPGEVPAYARYLQHVLSEKKYETKDARAKEDSICSCCGQPGTVYPNGLKGAGLNLFSVDRPGAFPGVQLGSAHKRFAVSLPCADLFYIYYQHVAKSYMARVSGEKALVVPCLVGHVDERTKFYQRFLRWLEGVEDGVEQREKRLLRFLSKEKSILNLQLFWASFGQELKDVEGMIMEILPSKLRALSALNQEMANWQHPLFPAQKHPLMRFTIAMPVLGLLLRHRGPQAKNKNKSPQIKKLRRELLAAIYKGKSGQRLETRFWRECHEIAIGYLMESFDGSKFKDAKKKVSYLLTEPKCTDKTKETASLSLAAWVRLLALVLHYLRTTGVFSMNQDSFYEPEAEGLKPYFGPESGINDKSKAFAFLVGVLFGKLLQVQAARGVNVSSNALSWLKRFRLKGSDLPELYTKIRSRFLVYGTEGSEELRKVTEEVGRLGVRLGTDITLDTTQTCYFLLLGQSMSTTILPSGQAKQTKNA